MIAVKKSRIEGHYHRNEWYECYGSDINDGVMAKCIDVSDTKKWDLIPLNMMTEDQVIKFFEKSKTCKYDLLGHIGIRLGFRGIAESYSASEWCGDLLAIDQPWRFNIDDLAIIIRRLVDDTSSKYTPQSWR